MAYRLTRRARRDVLQIWENIAKDSEATADHFIDLLIYRFELLGTFPMPAASATNCGVAIAAPLWANT